MLDPLAYGADRRCRLAYWDSFNDAPGPTEVVTAPDDAILIVDGAFLLRPELSSSWDLVIWLHIPGHTTAHRDPAAYGGVVAVFNLFGQALFRVWDADGEAAEWETGRGQLVLMRAAGWPQPDSRCPLHEVEPPRDEERMIMTLRHNTGGAGAGYVV